MFEEYQNIKGCACGRPHQLITKDFIVEKDALEKLPDLLAKRGLGADPLAVYDGNTFAAAHPKLSSYLPDVRVYILEGNDIHADEARIEELKAQATGHSVLLGVGSGVICDLTRYVASMLTVPFICVPTAASVDGYVSGASALTRSGAKVTVPAQPPVAVVADLEIISAAPLYLSASGVGDMLSKYISAVDWHIGHLITGEYYCRRIADICTDAADTVVSHIKQIKTGDLESTGKLVEGLLLSGIAIQLAGVTRPASSFEHHISHFLENFPMKGLKKGALHGEKVGVGTVFAARNYLTMATRLKDIFEKGLPNKFSYDQVRAYYSDLPAQTIEMVVKENTPNISQQLDVGLLKENYAQVISISEEIPSYHLLRQTLEEVDGAVSYSDLGLSEEQFRDIARRACYARNRFTVPRVVADYQLLDIGSLPM